MNVIKKNCAKCLQEFVYDKYRNTKFCSRKCYKDSVPRFSPKKPENVEIKEQVKIPEKSWSQKILEFLWMR